MSQPPGHTPTSDAGCRLPAEVIYRYNPSDPKPFFVPGHWQEAELYLRAGNELIVRFNDACKRRGRAAGERPPVIELSALEAEALVKGDDGFPAQMPFAVMLGCADARVPSELLFGQEFNDIFNIRVAGNVLAEEGIGSLQYALRTFVPEPAGPDCRSLRLVCVLGHRGCGAVGATVRAFLDPLKDASLFGEPIGAILRRITSPPLIVAADAFNQVFGAGAATDPAHMPQLIDLTVYLNAAWVAHDVQEWVDREGPAISGRVGVVYCVVDPHDLRVHALPPCPADPHPSMFAAPPKNHEALRALAFGFAQRLAATSG